MGIRPAERFASLFIIMAGCLWGIIGIFSNSLSAGGCSSVEITFIRNAVAAAGLWLFLILFKRKRLKIHIKDIWMFLGTGILSIVFFNIMYFITIQISTLSIAAILLYTAPSFVMIMSIIFFHEKITKSKITALILAFSGCVFTTGIIDNIVGGTGIGSISGLGILTGVCSGLGYALYSVFGNVALKKYHSETVTAYTFLIAAISLAPFCVNAGLVEKMSCMAMTGNALGIGLLSTLAPFCLYTMGLKNTEPGRASVMAFAEPMVATFVGVFVLKQSISFAGITGIILIFLSIVILNSKLGNKKS